MSRRTRALGLIQLSLAAVPLAACAALPPSASMPAAGRLVDARDGGDGAIALTLALPAARRVASAIRPYDRSDVNHLVVSVAKFNGTGYDPLMNALGAPIAVDLTGYELDGSVTLTGLRRNATYQLQVMAYKSPGTNASDMISLTDASSLATVTIGTDQAPQPLALEVTLIPKEVTAAFDGPPAAFDDDPVAPGNQPDGINQSAVAVAYATGSQHYMAVWRDDRLDPGRPSLYAQVTTATGEPVGGPVLVSDGVHDAGPPAIAYDAQRDRFLVAWDSPGNPIQANVVSSEGVAGTPFSVDSLAPSTFQGNPALAYSPTADSYVVAWVDNRGTPGHSDILAKRVDAGTLAPDAAAIRAAAPGAGDSSRGEPTLAWVPAGDQFAVAFSDLADATETGTIRVGRLGVVAGALATVGPEVSMPGGSDQAHPSLAHDALTGATLVAWDDDRDQATLGRELYAQRLSTTFALLDSPTALLNPLDAAGDQDQPRVAFNAIAREYVIGWVDRSGPTGGIYVGRRTPTLDAIGAPLALEMGVGERDAVAIAHADDAAVNRSLLLWGANGRITHLSLDSRYVP